MSLNNYHIGTRRNSYFNGRDGVLYRDEDEVAVIALKHNCPAINVKVYHWGTDASKLAQQDIGDTACERIAEIVSFSFWEFDAPDLAESLGFSNVYAEGRSGGWLTAKHANGDHWWEEIAIDAEFPEAESVHGLFEGDYEDRLHAQRYRFFQLAEKITAMVEYNCTYYFDDLVFEAQTALEAKRESVLIRGCN